MAPEAERACGDARVARQPVCKDVAHLAQRGARVVAEVARLVVALFAEVDDPVPVAGEHRGVDPDVGAGIARVHGGFAALAGGVRLDVGRRVLRRVECRVFGCIKRRVYRVSHGVERCVLACVGGAHV